jgi:hypothetical protein
MSRTVQSIVGNGIQRKPTPNSENLSSKVERKLNPECEENSGNLPEVDTAHT